MLLSGKKVLLGVSASIAAYKSAFLVRLLVKAGAEVKVVLTPSAQDFVTPLTLSTLSKNPVNLHFTDPDDEGAEWNNHVELGLWADLMIIAPATSNTMAKMAQGICDNLLMATYLSAKCPVYFAPAMDLDMYRHPATKNNLDILQKNGQILIPAGTGELASGLIGEGRMAEPEEIIAFIENDLQSKAPLHGKRVLVNAGPTYEAIDAVRFIGNHSTGKMGVAIARAAYNAGAEVVLVLGPTTTHFDLSGIQVIRVQSAAEMFEACESNFSAADIAIFSAAVSDYTPKTVFSEKRKKGSEDWSIELVPTVDILGTLAREKQSTFVVGFALETNDGEVYALDKLERKNLDLVVLNTLQDSGAGFGHDTNKVTIFSKDKKRWDLALSSKEKIAGDLLQIIVEQL